MRSTLEDNFKTRLTERAELYLAVQTLMSHGIPEEQIPSHLARLFYVDMDELNAVLKLIATERTEDQPSPQPAFRRVA